MEARANSVSCVLLFCLVFMTSGERTNTPGYAAHLKSLKDRPNKATLHKMETLQNDLTRTIAAGIQLAHQQCMENFKWERWNCSELAFSRRYIGPVTREKAYVASITAAGITHSVAKFCAKGTMLPECSCKSDSEVSKFSEEGCSSNLKTGQWISREFLNSLEKKAQDVIASINMHNYEIGFKATELKAAEQVCKCHGVSGACSTKTCWTKIAPFPAVGDHIKVAYKRAIKVAVNRNNFENGFGLKNKFGNLLFMTESPNYCRPNPTQGWFGTEGRICSRNKGYNVSDVSERKSCRQLCKSCGHHVRTRMVHIASKCNCKFDWISGVTCNICTRREAENYCHASSKVKRFKGYFKDSIMPSTLRPEPHPL